MTHQSQERGVMVSIKVSKTFDESSNLSDPANYSYYIQKVFYDAMRREAMDMTHRWYRVGRIVVVS